MTFGYVRKSARGLCLLFGVALALSPTIAHAQDITTGLIGHWELDETSGATITDSGSAGNDGTWIDDDDNDVATETIAGRIGNALNFNGSSDYISILGATGVSLSNADNFTLAAWVRLNSCQANGSKIFEKKSGLSDSIHLQCYGANNLPDFTPRDDDMVSFHNYGTTLINDNTWHHVIGIKDGNTLYTYVDGVLEGTDNTTVFTGDFNAADMRIGYSRDGGARYIDGALDDVRIYNRALTVPDVAALFAYTGAPPPDCASPDGYAGEIIYNEDNNVMQYCNATDWIAIGPKVALSDGLVGHWELDETTGSAITDSSGNANNGTWDDNADNDVSGETTTGPIGDALTFDNVDDYIGIPYDAALAPTNAITFSAWFNTNDRTTAQRILSKTHFGGYHLSLSENSSCTNDTLCALIDIGGTYYDASYAVTNINNNTWHHAVGVYDGSEIRLYHNGSLVDSTPIAGTIQYTNNNSLIIGAEAGATTTPENIVPFFDGSIDEVRVYDRALSPTEVQSLYDMGPSCMEPPSTTPVAHWTMDDTNGNTIVDSSGNGLNGTWLDYDDSDVVGETEPGIVGNALHFDGADDHIRVPYTPILDLTDTGGTVMAWIRSDIAQVGQNRVWGIFRKQSHTNNAVDAAYEFGPHQSGSTSPMYLSSRYSGTYFKAGTTIIQPNQWYHVVMSWDNDNSYLYIDGNVERVGAKPNTINYFQNAISTIGHGSSGAGQRTADGLIDDLRIYNETLTPLEISSIYGATGGQCTIALCTNPWGQKGEIVYNADFNVMQYCNGGSWIAMGPPGDGGASCANPSGLAGTLRYDEDNSVLMYCEGDQWMAVAGHAASPLAGGPCPNPGDECPDGTVYAGITPDGSVPMYVPHCDAGMSWDGSTCTGSRTATPWNNGNNSGYTLTTANSTTAGAMNTALLAITDSDTGVGGTQPHQAAEYCDSLVQDGHNDWYLPAHNELNVIYANNAAIGNFNSAAWYWSSTAHNSNSASAWLTVFSSGNPGESIKYSTTNMGVTKGIRCARNNNPAPVTDPCAGSPSPGDVCTDGTVFAGNTPDGSVAMYTTRCDAGMSWDGSNCTGVRTTMAWNDGDTNYVTTGYTGMDTGRANTSGLVSMDANLFTAGHQDHIAAAYCDNLTQDGHSDWYLPSLGELNVLSTNNAAIGNFESDYYWSSREQSNNSAWRRNIVTSSNAIPSKASASNIRCTRNPSAAPASAPVFAFSDVTDQPASTLMTSDLAQVTGLIAAETITVSGDGSPEYRICSNSLCGTEIQGWTSAGGTITNNQYVQLRTTTSAANSTTYDVDLTIDSTTDTWSATTIAVSATPCSGSPAIGTVCADGTVYAGLSPDGNAPMYVTPADQASGGIYWGTQNYSTGATSFTTGQANSATVYADVMAGNGDANPEDGYTNNASIVCNNLNFAGHDDWYIPARDELAVLRTNRAAIGGFSTGYFWTSSENSSTHVWGQRFSDGFQTGSIAKQFNSALRCVRQGVSDPCVTTPVAGTVCADGSVYVDGTIYTTPSDVSGSAYFGTRSYTTGATSTTDGEANTATIYADVLAGNGSGNPDDGVTPNAAVLCSELSFGGHTDWYLPAEDEVSILYTNRVAIGNFNTSDEYWTSTEFAPDGARATPFNTGNASFYQKSWGHSTRCIRQ